MQRKSFLSWDRRRTSRKTSLDRIFNWSDKPSSPTTTSPSAPTSLGRETFWPATLDRECDRAARILKSFCSDGFLAPQDDVPPPTPGFAADTTSSTSLVLRQIPPRVIQNAAGIAIFTCMRSGLWMTGSGGSGILIARKADGTWSPPSGLLLHTPTLSFIIGVDIYDCVLVVNNLAALESLTRASVTLGEDISLINGPLIPFGEPDTAIARRSDGSDAVFAYLKARGQLQHVNLHGCILTERANENERFYSGNLSVLNILAGNVYRHVEEAHPLYEVIKGAEGRTDADPVVLSRLAQQPAPGDAIIDTPVQSPKSPMSPKSAFGVPNADDPDPFGVLALEMAGLEIREAGTKLRPSSHQFEYNPSPTSPVFSKFGRQSVDTYTSRSNRGSYMSTRTEKTKLSDVYTHPDLGVTPGTTPSPGQSDDGLDAGSNYGDLPRRKEPEDVDYTKIDLAPLRKISGDRALARATTVTSSATSTDEPPTTDAASVTDDAPTRASSVYTKDDELSDDGDADDEGDDEGDLEYDEEPIVYEIASAVQPVRTAAIASPIQAKGALVLIPKRIPPPLPLRSPARTSRASKSELGDVSHLQSPLRSSFTDSARPSLEYTTSRAEDVEHSSYRPPASFTPSASQPGQEANRSTNLTPNAAIAV